MKRVYIVDALRLPVGSFGGFYKNNSPKDLGAAVIKAIVKHSGINPSQIDEVIVGNIMQTDPKGNPGREAWLDAGMPIEVPSFTINKNCASSAKAIALGATSIMAGKADMILAVGMENMSAALYVLRNARYGYRMGNSVLSDLLTDLLIGMGMTAEKLAEQYHLSRKEIDEFSLRSQQKATKAWENNVFADEIVPFSYVVKGKELTIYKDEGFKPTTTLEGLMQLKPTFKSDGVVTAGNSSTINDGAGAVLLVSEAKMKELNKQPLLEVIDFASAGVDPSVMGIGPVPAIQKLLKQTGLTIQDIDVFELNEAFASQALAVMKELKIDEKKVNPNGSGISLGHPVGATGAILSVKIAHHMKKHHLKYGVVTMCIGGGQGFAMLLKNPAIK